MSLGPLAAILCGAIALLVALRAAFVVRAERGALRGSPPGRGHHVIDASYMSGLGGHHASFTVPRDPQDYARRLMPARLRAAEGARKEERP